MYDPSYNDKKKIWQQVAANNPTQPYAGDIMIQLLFVMPRPKSHYRTGKYKHLLKDIFKDTIYHSFTPDLDNLVKMICDTVQGKDRMIVDDSQICVLDAQKLYGKPRTEVIIEEIS